ncbi:putative mariner transposase [Trichonephila clavipes]|nr:putative mariner transposase [Trichonephila clavipes]
MTRIVKGQVMSSPSRPAHPTLTVKRFLVEYNILLLDHLLYSTDLAPCKFYRFHKVKSASKRTSFELVEAVEMKAVRVSKEVTQEDFQHCFKQWKAHMESCRDRG